MARTLLDAVVQTDYGQLDLTWQADGGFDGDADRFFAGQVNGLVGAADADGVYLCLGRRSGGSHLTIRLLDSGPGDPPAEWEDVVEVSFRLPPGRTLGWRSWAGETGGSLPEVPPGSYRLRFGCRGRDAGVDGEFAEQVLDWYLVEIWAAPAGEDAILRTTSRDAAYWHAAYGNRRSL